MSANKLWLDKGTCEAYVEEQEKISLVSGKEREIERQILSYYFPDKDKVHVGLGIGGGLDFDLLKDIPKIVRKIGVDYSPYMLKLCKDRHSDVELIKDDIRTLKKLGKVLQKEKRPTIFTLLTNTLGNFELEERRRIVKAVRSVMKDEDLLVAELYKRPELLGADPGLLPDMFLKAKIRQINFEKKAISEPIPLVKSFPFNLYLSNPQSAWMLHSISQQYHYGEVKAIQKIIEKVGHAAYWPETGDVIIYRLRKHKPGETIYYTTIKSRREEFEKYFESVLISHRFEGMEVASTFLNAGLLGNMINGANTFILFFIPWYKGKESLREFDKRYYGLFYQK